MLYTDYYDPREGRSLLFEDPNVPEDVYQAVFHGTISPLTAARVLEVFYAGQRRQDEDDAARERLDAR